MSKQGYSEVDPSDREIEDYLDEIYPEDVVVCGYKMTQSYVLKRMDRIAFDMFGSDNMRWYKCDICDTIYKDDDAEDSAIECCQKTCDECGKDLDDDYEADMCEDCLIEEENDEDEDIDSESIEEK
jgi:hypothetical protein